MCVERPIIPRARSSAGNCLLQNGIGSCSVRQTITLTAGNTAINIPAWKLPSVSELGGWGGREATHEEIESARRGVGKIYCQAQIGYLDMRDNLRETGSCYFYDFSVRDFYLCPEKGANYHT
jgi:hypothetical protein